MIRNELKTLVTNDLNEDLLYTLSFNEYKQLVKHLHGIKFAPRDRFDSMSIFIAWLMNLVIEGEFKLAVDKAVKKLTKN